LQAAGITPEQAASATFMKGKGCNNCGHSGYRGRLGIFELLMMTSKIRELAFQGASTQDIRKEAVKGGMSTLYDDGIRKVLEGVTTIDEVFRVAKRSE
jgi:type IV pilus assembly protein PilB